MFLENKTALLDVLKCHCDPKEIGSATEAADDAGDAEAADVELSHQLQMLSKITPSAKAVTTSNSIIQ